MTQPGVTRPTTSQTQQPGYVPASAGTTTNRVGLTNNVAWQNAFIEYLVTRWANGDHSIVPPGQYGIPDAADNGFASPATWLAFTQWAKAYQPGDNPQVDQIMPYIPPGPNDYQESPAQTAARIANDQWSATFGQTQTNDDRRAWQQAFADQIQSYGYQVAGAKNANDFANALFGEQGANARSANSLAGQIYSTQGGMYNTSQGNVRGALEHAGTLASELQKQWDARTQNAINLQAHPNDFIQRESAIRALQPPTGTDVPAYRNVDALQEVINRLINFQPGSQPTPPTSAAMPTPPTYQPPPAPPQQTPFQPTVVPHPGMTMAPGWTPSPGPAAHPPGVVPAPGVRQVAAPGTTGSYNTGTATAGQNSVDQSGNVWEDNGTPGGVWHDHAGHESHDGGKTWIPSGGNQLQTMAYGGTLAYALGGDPDSHSFIAGDPQADGQPNPELIQLRGKGVRAKVTPLRNMMGRIPRYAYGTDGVSSGRYNYGGIDQNMAGGQSSGQSNLYGVGYTGQQAPQVYLKSYPDSAYQNLPSLQYLLGNMPRTTYNTLRTGYAPGAFGTQAPESGSINYGRALDIARDPVSQAMMESIYSSANRDYLAEVARAKERAPFGQAVQTSLIKT